MARELSIVVKVEDAEAAAKLRAIDAQMDKVGASSSTAAKGVAEYDVATAAMVRTQELATASTSTLDAALATETAVLASATAATETASVASGAYGSILFTQAEATTAVAEASEAAAVSTVGLGGQISGAIAKFSLYGIAAQVVVGWLVQWYEAHEKAAVATETLAAKQDVINKALSEGARAGISYGDAIKYVNEQERHRLAMIPNAAADAYIQKLIDQGTAAMHTAAEEAALTEGLAARGLVLGGVVDVEKLMTEARKKSAEAAAKQAKADQDYFDAVVKLSHELYDIEHPMRDNIFLMGDLGKLGHQASNGVDDLEQSFDALQKKLAEVERQGIPAAFTQADVKWQQLGQHVDVIPPKLRTVAQSLRDLGSELDQLGSQFDGFVGQFISGAGRMVTSFQHTADAIAHDGDNLIAKLSSVASAIDLIFKAKDFAISIADKFWHGRLDTMNSLGEFQSQFSSFKDMVDQVTSAFEREGRSADEAKQRIHELFEALASGRSGVDIIKDLQDALDKVAHDSDILKEASSMFGPSQPELEATEKHLHEMFDAMTTAGTYSASQLEKAYYAWQKAMADAGNEAAQAWVKAHDAATEGAKAADAAMQKLLDRRDELNKGISQEAWEPVMGETEKAMRTERDGIEQQIKDAENAAHASAEAQGKAADDAASKWKDKTNEWTDHLDVEAHTSASQTSDDFEIAATQTADHFQASANTMHDGFTTAADDAASHIKGAFDFSIHIPIHFDSDSLPVVPQASGGDWWVTKPTLFLAGEAGPERATFTPLGKSSRGDGSSSGGTVVHATINAVDAKSFEDLVKRNPAVIAHAAMTGIANGGKPMGLFRKISRQV